MPEHQYTDCGYGPECRVCSTFHSRRALAAMYRRRGIDIVVYLGEASPPECKCGKPVEEHSKDELN